MKNIQLKSFTDLEQSKKLADILPLDSADMYYQFVLPRSEKIKHTPEIGSPIESLKWYNKGYTQAGKEALKMEEYCIPCWSLATLLVMLNKNFYINLFHDGVTWNFRISHHDRGEVEMSMYANTPIDACYEMIIKLHEQKLLL